MQLVHTGLNAKTILFLFNIVVTQQVAQAAEEPPTPPKINAVERGFFLEMDPGLSYVVSKVNDQSYGLSFSGSLYAGYDILPMLSIGFGGTLLAASYSGDSTITPRGDLYYVAPNGYLQFAFVTTERMSLWLRGLGGYAFGLPHEIDGVPFGADGPFFGGSLGIERFTKLRHFSIGLQVGATVALKPDTLIAVGVIPLFKYTF